MNPSRGERGRSAYGEDRDAGHASRIGVLKQALKMAVVFVVFVWVNLWVYRQDDREGLGLGSGHGMARTRETGLFRRRGLGIRERSSGP